MKTDLNKVIALYFKRYEKIFDIYYPSHDSTGFTERNQSVNFSSAMESIYSKTFTWYEVPLKTKYEHCDAVIFNRNTKEMFVIEAKRFDKPSKKISELLSDVRRIINKESIDLIKTEYKNPEIDNFKFYALLLADVWLETPKKKKIYNEWGENFFKIFAPESDYMEIQTKLSEQKWIRSTNNTRKYNNWRDKYELLIMAGLIL